MLHQQQRITTEELKELRNEIIELLQDLKIYRSLWLYERNYVLHRSLEIIAQYRNLSPNWLAS